MKCRRLLTEFQFWMTLFATLLDALLHKTHHGSTVDVGRGRGTNSSRFASFWVSTSINHLSRISLPLPPRTKVYTSLSRPLNESLYSCVCVCVPCVCVCGVCVCVHVCVCVSNWALTQNRFMLGFFCILFGPSQDNNTPDNSRTFESHPLTSWEKRTTA